MADFIVNKDFKWHIYERSNNLGSQKFDYGYEGILYRCLPKILFKGNPNIVAFLQMIDMRLIMMFKTIDKIKHFKNIHKYIPVSSNNVSMSETHESNIYTKDYIEFIFDEGIDYLLINNKKYYSTVTLKLKHNSSINYEVVPKNNYELISENNTNYFVNGDNKIYLNSNKI